MELLDNAVGSHVRNPSFGNVVRQKFADANSPTRGTVSSVKLSRKNSNAKNTGPYSDASIYSIPSRAIPRNARKQIIVNEGRDQLTVQRPDVDRITVRNGIEVREDSSQVVDPWLKQAIFIPILCHKGFLIFLSHRKFRLQHLSRARIKW